MSEMFIPYSALDMATRRRSAGPLLTLACASMSGGRPGFQALSEQRGDRCPSMTVTRTGWHEIDGKNVFVLPRRPDHRQW